MFLTDSQIQLIVSYFAPKPIAAVYLCGSYARGDADEKSDVDIILELHLNSFYPLEISAYRNELMKLLGLKIDLCLKHEILRYSRESVLSESRLLFRKNQIDV